MSRTIVQFGAGNIGRGFMGQIYTDAGYEVVFVDVAPGLVPLLNERRRYTLRMVGPDRFQTRMVEPVRAVDGRDLPRVAEELARCEFACTAVGVPALPHVAPALAAGIRLRAAPLNVLLCENQLRCSELLRGYLRPLISEQQLAGVGLVESVVSRMVPVVPEAERRADPLLVIAEDYPVLPVDAAGFVGAPPAVPALRVVDRFAAYVERKLFLHNMGHASAAYLGHQRGWEYVHEAMTDPAVRAVVTGAMAEAGEALARKHGLDRAELRQHAADLVRRFANPELRDTIRRVAKDPVRKLRAEDRLVGAALACLEADVEPREIARATAAALRYHDPADPAAAAIRKSLREAGPEATFERFTGQAAGSRFGQMVLKQLAEGRDQ